MNAGAASLTPSGPTIWRGRYARIPGESTAFHIRLRGHDWWPFAVWVSGAEIANCPMAESDEAAHLARAVNGGKRYLGAPSGGSFQINEFGQVLVPSSVGDGRVALVGKWTGGLEFADPLRGGTFDLAPATPLASGDRWDRPYLGTPYHLSLRSEIYFWNRESRAACKQLPATQDDALIDALRALRPSGPVRFVAAYGGLVLTKVPGVPCWNIWEARYVGRIDFDRWFTKEA